MRKNSEIANTIPTIDTSTKARSDGAMIFDTFVVFAKQGAKCAHGTTLRDRLAEREEVMLLFLRAMGGVGR